MMLDWNCDQRRMLTPSKIKINTMTTATPIPIPIQILLLLLWLSAIAAVCTIGELEHLQSFPKNNNGHQGDKDLHSNTTQPGPGPV